MPIDEHRIASLRGQRQTRSYTPSSLDPAARAAMIEVARWTGSASNRQPWKFVVVEDRDLLTGLSTAKGGSSWIANAAAAFVILTEGTDAQASRFDVGRVAERLLLAANAVGLAGAIVSWVPRDGEEAVRSLLHVPAGLWIYAAVIVGQPAPTPSTPSKNAGRKPVSEIVIPNAFA